MFRRRVVVPLEHQKPPLQWRPMWIFSGSALLAGSVYYYYSHRTAVPISGRERFISLSLQSERRMGANSFEQILQSTPKNKIVTGALPQKIREIIERLVANSGFKELQELNWKVLVLNDPTPNAFVLPGGYVVVFTGILPVRCRFMP